MIVEPKIFTKTDGRFEFGKKITISVPKNFYSDIVSEMFKNFSCGICEAEFVFSDEESIKCGTTELIELDGHEYTINVTSNGFAINGENVTALLHGYFMLLDMIKALCCDEGKEKFYIECCKIMDTPRLNVRMIHICVFPETSLHFLRKIVRLSAVLKYSHIIIEFWGMLKYDCLKELSWDNAYTKDEIREIVDEAKNLGIVPIPMFNHLGHASQSREINGKHVVLDQNPALAPLFDEDGWSWNIENPNTLELLKKIRQELICVFGTEGGFFHIGCDEAYRYAFAPTELMATHINTIAKDLENNGMRAIMWGDMLLPEGEMPKDYIATGHDPNLIDALDKNIIVAEWQYGVSESPWISSQLVNSKGFDVVTSPWYNPKNIYSAANTVADEKLFGLLLTTWNTLSERIFSIAHGARSAWNDDASSENIGGSFRTETASLVRKIMPPKGVYENSGWTTKDTFSL